MPGYVWNRRRSIVWGAHVAAIAPFLYLFRDTPGAVAALLVAMLGYHAYRMTVTHGCQDSYAELNMFHIVFVFPVLMYMATRRLEDALGVVALAMAAYFAGKFALYGTCVRRENFPL